MNKYIKTDVEQGILFLKVAINNALSDLENGEEKIIKFEAPIPLQLIIECAKDRGWEEDPVDDWTNGWEVDYCYYMIHPNRDNESLCIDGSLLMGNTVISIEQDI